MQVASTILSQLGGSKFQCMTGARQFVSSDNSLTFKLPSRFAKMGINCVKISVIDDLYTISFYILRGTRCQEVAKVEGVYNDMLTKIFTEYTGLDTRL